MSAVQRVFSEMLAVSTISVGSTGASPTLNTNVFSSTSPSSSVALNAKTMFLSSSASIAVYSKLTVALVPDSDWLSYAAPSFVTVKLASPSSAVTLMLIGPYVPRFSISAVTGTPLMLTPLSLISSLSHDTIKSDVTAKSPIVHNCFMSVFCCVWVFVSFHTAKVRTQCYLCVKGM